MSETLRPLVDTAAVRFAAAEVLPAAIVNVNGHAVDLTRPRWRMPAGTDDPTEVRLSVYLLGEAGPTRGHDDEIVAPTRGAAERRAGFFDAALVMGVKLWIASRLTKLAPLSVRSYLAALVTFERFCHEMLYFERAGRPITIADISPELLDAIRRRTDERKARAEEVCYYVAAMYRWCARQRVPGFNRHTARELAAMSFQNRIKGHIAQMDCPYRGAFSMEERAQVERAIKAGAGALQDRALVALFFYLGLRPAAVQRLRRRDLHVPEDSGGHWFLSVPRVKQRAGSAPLPRRRRIHPVLGALLHSLPVLPGDDPRIFALPGREPTRVIRDSLRRWADHDDVDLVTTRVAPDAPPRMRGWRAPGKTVKRPEFARLPFTPYRFRRTIATLLAAHGADEHTIAAALDDRSLAMASIYAQNSSSMVEVLERTLDRHPTWVRVVGLWLGRVMEPGDASLLAVEGGAFQLAKYEEYADIGTVVHCANPEPCTLFPPLSCYHCPWAKAVPNPMPHRRQLAQIKDEMAAGIGRESDRMAAIFERDAAAIVQLLAELSARGGDLGRAIDAIDGEVTRRPTEEAQ